VNISIFHLDAFTDRPFAGNPAAVCPLPRWLPEETMQAIAAENALSETAFLVREEGGAWHIRWFTPALEVELCGHATLASAHVVLSRLEPGRRDVTFRSASGDLVVRRDGERLAMIFPRWPLASRTTPEAVRRALGRAPLEALHGRDWMAVLAAEEDVRALEPDLAAVRALDAQGLIVTAPGAPGSGVDFVSRYFAPAAGIDEDPVTGSAHCALVPYWSARLRKKVLAARQVSQRGGELACEDLGDAVLIAGRVTPYLEGSIEVG
jgi:predicted PhzF superfamily epimerase YddE/YHI9